MIPSKLTLALGCAIVLLANVYIMFLSVNQVVGLAHGLTMAGMGVLAIATLVVLAIKD